MLFLPFPPRQSTLKERLPLWRALASIIAVLSGSICSLATASDYYVDATRGSNLKGDGSRTRPWCTISYSLTKISGRDHTIHVAPGTYDNVMNGVVHEVFPLRIPAGISLVGAGPGVTVIDAQHSNTVLNLNGASTSTVIDGLTIKNGKTWRGYGARRQEDGCIYLNDSSPVIKNNIVEGCVSDTGGAAILAEGDSNPKIVHNLFRNNTCERSGGIVEIRSGESVLIDRNFFQNNSGSTIAGDSAAIYVNSIESSSITIQNNVIANTAGNGISILHSWAHVTIANNNIVDSTFSAIFLGYGGRALIRNNILTGNDRYGIEEYNWGSFTTSDPLEASYNLFYDNNLGLYLDEGVKRYSDVSILNAEVPECKHNIEGDPLFQDDSEEDYHLSEDSPCIDAGISRGAPEYDVDGHRRSRHGQGQVIDIGAGETQATEVTRGIARSVLQRGQNMGWPRVGPPATPVRKWPGRVTAAALATIAPGSVAIAVDHRTLQQGPIIAKGVGTSEMGQGGKRSEVGVQDSGGRAPAISTKEGTRGAVPGRGAKQDVRVAALLVPGAAGGSTKAGAGASPTSSPLSPGKASPAAQKTTPMAARAGGNAPISGRKIAKLPPRESRTAPGASAKTPTLPRKVDAGPARPPEKKASPGVARKTARTTKVASKHATKTEAGARPAATHRKTVIATPGPEKPVAKLPGAQVSLKAEATTLFAGETITAQANTSSGMDSSYTWRSSNESIASIGLPHDGIVTIRGNRRGSASITATGVDSGASSTFVLTVKRPDVTVTLSQNDSAVGGSVTASAATSNHIDSTYRWISSNTNVATISVDSGASVEVKSVGSGITTITAVGTDSKVSGSATFIVVSNDTDIVLVAPENGGPLSVTSPPAFTWFTHDQSGFTLEISASRDFSDPASTFQYQASNTGYAMGSQEWKAIVAMSAKAERLYWRAVSTREGGETSRTWQFTLAPFNPPYNLSAVALSGSEVELTWTNAERYDGLRVYWNRNGSRVYRQVVSETETSFIDTDLPPGTEFSYQIMAHRHDQWVGSRVVAVSTLPRNYEGPTLLAPRDRTGELDPNDITLSWTGNGADSVHYWIGVFDSMRSTLIWKWTDGNSLTLPAGKLAYDSTYYWRVWANDGAFSEWLGSKTWRFTTRRDPVPAASPPQPVPPPAPKGH